MNEDIEILKKSFCEFNMDFLILILFIHNHPVNHPSIHPVSQEVKR